MRAHTTHRPTDGAAAFRARAAARRPCVLFPALLAAATLLLVAGAAPVLARGGGAGAVARSAAGTGAIAGTVTNHAGAGVGGISVTAYRNDGDGWDYIDDISTDKVTGAYSIADLDPGPYQVSFDDSAGVYFVQWWDHVASQDEASVVQVVAGGTSSGVDASLTGRPKLGPPQCPSSAKHGKKVTVSGTLKPQFPSGSHTVHVVELRHTHHGWAEVKTWKAVNKRKGRTTRYVAVVKLQPGKYRFKATSAATADWLASSSKPGGTIVVH